MSELKVLLGAGAALLLVCGAAAAAPTAAKGPPGTIPLDIKDEKGAPVFGNPTTGKTVFATCGTCHSIAAGQNKVGPSLHGIINRHSGSIPNFRYSAANKKSGIVWTEQNLYTYLASPQKMVPGTYMSFTGYKEPQKRADVIAYLQQATK
jgi:cytochrome c